MQSCSVNSGSSATISPLKIGLTAVSSALLSLISIALPTVSSAWSMTVAYGVAQPHDGRVRLEQVVLHLHVEELRHQLLRELLAVDQDLDAGGRVRVRVRHQPSISGSASAVPRRRRSGSSIALASAIVRQVVASPYAR